MRRPVPKPSAACDAHSHVCAKRITLTLIRRISFAVKCAVTSKAITTKIAVEIPNLYAFAQLVSARAIELSDPEPAEFEMHKFAIVRFAWTKSQFVTQWAVRVGTA
jgi:hypothetical protein